MGIAMLKGISFNGLFASLDQQRVRSSLSRMDPEGIALRWSYTVIDGQHSLIRWRLVIHGGDKNVLIIVNTLVTYTFIVVGIDGYSRIPVYLNCSSITESTPLYPTSKQLFPPMDCLVEYVLIAGLKMLELRTYANNARNGPSQFHSSNQRIERLWRDVTNGNLQGCISRLRRTTPARPR